MILKHRPDTPLAAALEPHNASISDAPTLRFYPVARFIDSSPSSRPTPADATTRGFLAIFTADAPTSHRQHPARRRPDAPVFLPPLGPSTPTLRRPDAHYALAMSARQHRFSTLRFTVASTPDARQTYRNCPLNSMPAHRRIHSADARHTALAHE